MKKKKKKIFAALADEFRGTGAEPPCAHFGECGGCLFQDIPYANQLELKKTYLNRLMDGSATVDTVSGAGAFGYRNRMDMVCAFGKRGLRRAGSYRHVVDVTRCEIMQPRSRETWEKLRPALLDAEDHDYLGHRGYLRYCILREAAFTGQLMVNFVVYENENRAAELVAAARDAGADSVSLLHQPGLADLSHGEVFETAGDPFIEETFEDIRFRITPNSFFQSNSAVALMLYRVIREHTRGRVLDCYSGVGTISLFVSGAAESVTGVEYLDEAVVSAEENRTLNRVENARFVREDARVYLDAAGERYHTIILDPPRSGLHPKMLPAVIAHEPERIIYVSCNPVHFRDDLALLADRYVLNRFEAFDMFPQTPHLETVAVLDRK